MELAITVIIRIIYYYFVRLKFGIFRIFEFSDGSEKLELRTSKNHFDTNLDKFPWNLTSKIHF